MQMWLEAGLFWWIMWSTSTLGFSPLGTEKSRLTQSSRLRDFRASTSANFAFNRLRMNQIATEMPTILTMMAILKPVSIFSPHNGGIKSMSMAPSGIPIQVSTAPSAMRSSSMPGGNISGNDTVPDFIRHMQVPQFPDVQLRGMSTPIASANSINGILGSVSVTPRRSSPR